MHLDDVGRFLNFDISFADGLNLVCGTNGVGKTSILNAVSACFVSSYVLTMVRGRAASEKPGTISAEMTVQGKRQHGSGTIERFSIAAHQPPIFQYGGAEKVIYLGAARDFEYVKQDSILRDVDKRQNAQVGSVATVPSTDIKQWITNRYLMRPHGADWPEFRIKNLELAISIFSAIDKSVKLQRVDSSTFDVYVETPSGVVPYEFLSSGFKALYVMMLGIIKELEFRGLDSSALDFDGLILIDEVDLHLHPTWQRVVPELLKTTFPAAQIIATTHSPHIIQAAAHDEVIPIVADIGVNPKVKKPSTSKYGFRGWTLEEILEDVMGVLEVRTPEYNQAMSRFDRALDDENAEELQRSFCDLDAMLHPSSHLRKLLRLQAAPVIGDAE